MNRRDVPGIARIRWAAAGAAVTVALIGGGLATTLATSSSGERDVFVPITPCRLFDTRPSPDGVGPRRTPIGPGATMAQAVRGQNGNCVLPPDVTAVAMNVTTTNGTAASYLTIWPSDSAQPLASSLNWVPGSPPTPNKVDVKLAANGSISLFNFVGTVDVLADAVGYYVDHNHDDRYYTKAEIDARNQDDRYYTKAQIDTKIPSKGSVTIGAAAFQGTASDEVILDDAFGCRFVRQLGAFTTDSSLDASVELPTGVTITKITVLIGNLGFSGGVATLMRRTLGSITQLAVVTTVGRPDGPYNQSVNLAVAEPVTSGRYYFLRFQPESAGSGVPVVCGAEISYTIP